MKIYRKIQYKHDKETSNGKQPPMRCLVPQTHNNNNNQFRLFEPFHSWKMMVLRI